MFEKSSFTSQGCWIRLHQILFIEKCVRIDEIHFVIVQVQVPDFLLVGRLGRRNQVRGGDFVSERQRPVFKKYTLLCKKLVESCQHQKLHDHFIGILFWVEKHSRHCRRWFNCHADFDLFLLLLIDFKTEKERGMCTSKDVKSA